MSRFFLLFLSLFSLLLIFLPSPSSAMTVYIKPNEERCFYEDIKKGEKILTEFFVAQGGHLDIDVKVYDPESKIVYEAERKMDENFQFIAMYSGPYKICFSNMMSTITGKVITFSIYVGNSLAQIHAAKAEHLSPLETGIISMSEQMNSVHNLLQYIKVREAVCANTAASTNQRSFWFNLMKLSALISVAAVQIFYLKHFFERTRKV